MKKHHCVFQPLRLSNFFACVYYVFASVSVKLLLIFSPPPSLNLFPPFSYSWIQKPLNFHLQTHVVCTCTGACIPSTNTHVDILIYKFTTMYISVKTQPARDYSKGSFPRAWGGYRWRLKGHKYTDGDRDYSSGPAQCLEGGSLIRWPLSSSAFVCPCAAGHTRAASALT